LLKTILFLSKKGKFFINYLREYNTGASESRLVLEGWSKIT
jgi:hypothetical protein